jgi:hypothetical protein
MGHKVFSKPLFRTRLRCTVTFCWSRRQIFQMSFNICFKVHIMDIFDKLVPKPHKNWPDRQHCSENVYSMVSKKVRNPEKRGLTRVCTHIRQHYRYTHVNTVLFQFLAYERKTYWHIRCTYKTSTDKTSNIKTSTLQKVESQNVDSAKMPHKL